MTRSYSEARFRVSLVEFSGLLDRFEAGDEAAFEALEGLPDDKVDDSVWAMNPDESERLIALNLSWPDAEQVANEVPKLARKHGLALMDPQSGLIVRP